MPNEYHQEGPKGIGGWLAFLIIVLGVISPVRIIFDLFVNAGVPWKADWDILLTFVWVVNLATVAMSIYLAYRLYSGNSWRTVRFVVGGLWVVGPSTTALVWAFAFIFTPDAIGMDVVTNQPLQVIIDVVRSAVFSVIWTLYLLNSKRVRNTYSRGEADEIAETFA